MSLDSEDTPVGEIVALTLVVIIIFIVVVITFDSCTNFELDDMAKYCTDVKYEISPVLGEQKACWDEEGNARFAVLNAGTIPMEGVQVNHKEDTLNMTTFIPVQGQGNMRVQLGLRAGMLFSHFNVTPIVYYPEMEKNILCTRLTQKVKSLNRCGLED